MVSTAIHLQLELPPLCPLPKAVLRAPKAIFDAIDDQHGLLRIHGSVLFHTVDLKGGGPGARPTSAGNDLAWEMSESRGIAGNGLGDLAGN